MIRELERMTRDEFQGEPATALDYVELVVASGTTILELARQISKALGDPTGEHIKREALSKYVNGLEREADEGTLARARARGARAKAERAEIIAAGATKDTAAAAALLVRTLQWSAERDNPIEFGQQKGTTVNIAFGSLHLAALQAVQPVIASVPESVPVEDAEVLSIEAATS